MNTQSRINNLISQASLRADLDRDEIEYYYKMQEKLPEFASVVPLRHKEAYFEALEASMNYGFGNVCTYLLAELIPLQLGGLKFEGHSFMKPKLIPSPLEEFYMQTAVQAAKENPRFNTDILKALPEIVINKGASKARKIISTALKIKDEDFPGEYNVTLLYIGMNAGHIFGGSQEDHNSLLKLVEHKYLGKPIPKKRTFDYQTINEIISSIENTSDARKRRGFIDSTYAEIKKGKISEMDGKSIENFANLCVKYEFEEHARILLNSIEYKLVKEYDQKILRHEAPKGAPISAVYQTANTRKLDALFDLQDKPADREKQGELLTPITWLGTFELENIMPQVINLAARTGNFLGVEYQEAPNIIKASFSDLQRCVEEGYLEILIHDGKEIIAPTDKYLPFGIAHLARRRL